MPLHVSRRGFTLIELVVVIAIVGVLVGLSLAGVQRAREAAKRTECVNRLKNLGLAVLHFESTCGHLPPGSVSGPCSQYGIPDGVGHGMWPFLLPHIEQTPAANAYRFQMPFDHADNQPAATARIPVLMCPNLDPNRIEEWAGGRFGGVADYAPIEVNPFLADIGQIDGGSSFAGPLPVNGTVRMTDITDGTSSTILLAEAGGRPGVAWASPMTPCGLKGVFGGAGGPHRGGVPACMADGSVHFLRDTLELRVLARLATRNGGEPTPDF